MHIVLANQWFPPESGWGGVGVYNYEVAHAYRELGHDVSVIASRLSADIPSTQVADGIYVQRLLVRDPYYWRRLPIIGRYVRSVQVWQYARAVDRALRELQRLKPIDVIEFAEINAEGWQYARSPEVPFVVRCHTPTFVLQRYYTRGEIPYATSIMSRMERGLIQRAQAVTAPSHDLAKVIAAECRIPLESISVIPNALKIEEQSASRATALTERVTVLYVGRLERAKGVADLISVLPKVLQQCPTLRCVFVGDDRPTTRGSSQRAELEAQLAAQGVSAAVKFIGPVDQLSLLEWYRRADICVVPSLVYESFSYTCAQAMALGKPVIATRIGGIPETVAAGVTGLLVEPGNVADLAAAIIRLAQDRSLRDRLGRAGYEIAKVQFDPIKVAQQNLVVYERVREKFKSRA